jgi:F-box domain
LIPAALAQVLDAPKQYRLTRLAVGFDQMSRQLLTKVSCILLSASHNRSHKLYFAAKMPLMSLPMEVHREIMQYLDVKDLLSFSNVNQSVRAILHALPATEIEDLTREWYDWFQDNCGHDIWGRLDNWDVFYILERDHQDLLTAGDLIPCYGCAMCHPSADFGD